MKNCKIKKFDEPKGLVRWVLKAHLTLLDLSLTGYQNLNLICFTGLFGIHQLTVVSRQWMFQTYDW